MLLESIPFGRCALFPLHCGSCCRCHSFSWDLVWYIVCRHCVALLMSPLVIASSCVVLVFCPNLASVSYCGCCQFWPCDKVPCLDFFKPCVVHWVACHSVWRYHSVCGINGKLYTLITADFVDHLTLTMARPSLSQTHKKRQHHR
jgi:hypothetical protein